MLNPKPLSWTDDITFWRFHPIKSCLFKRADFNRVIPSFFFSRNESLLNLRHKQSNYFAFRNPKSLLLLNWSAADTLLTVVNCFLRTLKQTEIIWLLRSVWTVSDNIWCFFTQTAIGNKTRYVILVGKEETINTWQNRKIYANFWEGF